MNPPEATPGLSRCAAVGQAIARLEASRGQLRAATAPRPAASWARPVEQLAGALFPRAEALLQRHPLSAAAIAALAGFALVSWRPWQQPWCQGLLRQLAAPLGARLATLAHELPLAAWLAADTLSAGTDKASRLAPMPAAAPPADTETTPAPAEADAVSRTPLH